MRQRSTKILRQKRFMLLLGASLTLLAFQNCGDKNSAPSGGGATIAEGNQGLPPDSVGEGEGPEIITPEPIKPEAPPKPVKPPKSSESRNRDILPDGFGSPKAFKKMFRKIAVSTAPWSVASYFEKILLAYRLTNDPEYLEVLMRMGDKLVAQTSIERNVTDAFTGKKAHVLLTTKYSCGAQAAFLVHHGFIWAPIIAGTREYLHRHSRSLTSKQAQQITNIVGAAYNGLNYFNYQTTTEKGKTRYIVAKLPHKCDVINDLAHRHAPLNMAAAGGHLALELVRFFDQPTSTLAKVSSGYHKNWRTYYEKSESNLDTALNSVLPELDTDDDTGGRLIWRYMPDGRAEDTSHASLVVNFLTEARKGQYVNSTVMKGLLKTFHAQALYNPTKIFSHLEPIMLKGVDLRKVGDPAYVLGLERWLPLASYDCTELTKVRRIESYSSNRVKIYSSPYIQGLIMLYKRRC